MADAIAWETVEGLAVSFDTDGIPMLSADLLELGRSAAVAIALWGEWTHRKVESLDLLSGERARRRISVDCTPPQIQWQETAIFGSGIEPACLVPLTLMAKGPLRSLDVTDDAGRSVPVLGIRANGLVAALSLANWISIDGDPSIEAVLARVAPHWPDIYAIATAPSEEALVRAETVIKSLELPSTAATLVRELAECFLLTVVLPQHSAQRRQVLKYSYHWEMDPIKLIVGRLAPAFGWKPLTIELEVAALRTAASYHLECAVPEGLTATRISLPKSHGAVPATRGPMKVAHVSGAYDIAQDGRESPARISFLPDHNRLLPRIMWSGLAGTVIFAAILFAPGLREALVELPDPATAILLFIPAFFVALNARSSENVVVGGLLLPLRIYALVLAGAVFLGGALLALHLWPEFSTIWFVGGGLLGFTGFLASFYGWIRQVVRSRS